MDEFVGQKKKLSISSLRELGLVAIIIILYVIVGLVEPRFFSSKVVMSIMLATPILIVIGLGEMTAIISRNVDVSLGSIMAFSAIIGGMIFKVNIDFPIIIVFLIATIVGGVLGLFNGLIVTLFSLPSIIVTLGTMSIYRGLMFVLMDAKQIDNMHIPRQLIKLSQPQESIIGVPYIILISLGVAVIVAFILNRTKLGREIYAIGSNPEAARLRGINVNRVKLIVFSFAGACSGFAGMIYMSRIGYVNPITTGVGMEFMAVAAVVIGGTSMAGGSGQTLGTVFGCILLGLMMVSISYLGIDGSAQKAMYGLIIIIAVVMEKIIKTRLGKEGMQ